MITTHKEMTHVLGLDDNPYLLINNTGMRFWQARTVNTRYQQLTQKELNFHQLSSHTVETVCQNLSNMKHGHYVGYLAHWFSSFCGFPLGRGHVYSLHIIKENQQTHFIYVNRGERHMGIRGEHNDLNSTVFVFSVNTNKEKEFAKQLTQAAKSLDSHSSISHFLFLYGNDPILNKELMAKLQKSNQKTGNCMTANSNIAWHFQLAANLMKDNNLTLAEAYASTMLPYKKLRRQDRIAAWQFLLRDKKNYLLEKGFLHNYFQALEKLSQKRFTEIRAFTSDLIETLNKEELMILIKPLINNYLINFEHYKSAKLKKLEGNIQEFTMDELKEDLLNLAIKKLSAEVQIQLINEDITLIKYAQETIKNKLQEENRFKFQLYCIDSHHKSMEQLCNERKTSNRFFISGTEVKEKKINNKFAEFYSHLLYASADTNQVFVELCLICSEQRSLLANNNYSTDTQSVQWLIKKMQDILNDGYQWQLQQTLHVNTIEEITKKITEIIVNNNALLLTKTLS